MSKLSDYLINYLLAIQLWTPAERLPELLEAPIEARPGAGDRVGLVPTLRIVFFVSSP